MYLANVVLETIEKRLPFSRWWAEAVLVAAGITLLGLATGMVWLVTLLLASYLLLVLSNQRRERAIVNAVHAAQEAVGLKAATAARLGYPAPGLHPSLSLTIEGPLVSRWPTLDLGLLPAGHAITLTLVAGNHCRVPTQTPVSVALDVPPGWLIEGDASIELTAIQSGQVQRVSWTLRPAGGAPSGRIGIQVAASRFQRNLEIRHSGCRKVTADEVDAVSITRYPGARRSAFSWRGDMDLYDTASFQDIDGLKEALALSRRYGICQTMYLSTRLSLDAEEARAWATHYGVNRGAGQIQAFIDWMRSDVELTLSSPYPAKSAKPWMMELGNHGHLHYDTDTAGAEGNDWRAGTRPGGGRYPWQGSDHSSFGDQRDNIREAARWCEEKLGFRALSWAKPGRGNDEFSPAAVEAAGCEVATGSDIRPRDNVLRQPPPHHPAGTQIVELTARYPSDPQHIQHAAMLEFWMHRGHRLGIPVIILVHQHMRQFDGVVCMKLTEHLLRKAVDGFNGDLYIDTVYGIGRYWLDVLSGDQAKVRFFGDGKSAQVSSAAEHQIPNVPIDISLNDGSRMTFLVDFRPGQSFSIPDLLEMRA